MMCRILKIARREYIETVRTKTFLFGLLMTPIIIGLILYFTGRTRADLSGPRPASKIAVTDLSNELSVEIKASFDEHNRSNPHRQMRLKQLQTGQESSDDIAKQQKDKLRRGELDAYVVVEEDAVSGDGKIQLYVCGTKAASFDVPFTIERLLNRAVVDRRCKLQNLSRELLEELRRRVPVRHVNVGSVADEERIQNEKEKITRMMFPFFFMFMIFGGIMGAGQQMLSSVIEEKNSRVIEVLLSAVSPFELMTGKIVGLAGIGMTVMVIWGSAAYAAAAWRGINFSVGAGILPFFVIYYILGFLLFTSILAAIGSVCNTIRETQSLMMPVTLLIIIPMVSWFNIVQHPNGTLARALSFVPPLTPMVMVLRLSASSDTSLIEVFASIVLLAAAVLAMMWAASKIFRTGILMYGKRPALREVFRWLKQS